MHLRPESDLWERNFPLKRVGISYTFPAWFSRFFIDNNFYKLLKDNNLHSDKLASDLHLARIRLGGGSEPGWHNTILAGVRIGANAKTICNTP